MQKIPSMAIISAGILLYRKTPKGIEVLLAHHGGPFWYGKDVGSWSIPKGTVEEGENLLDTAKREFLEETGHQASGKFILLKPSKMRSGKIVHAFALEGDLDPNQLKSNTLQLEWPPESGTIVTYPEIDKIQWFSITKAKAFIIKGQLKLLEELETKLLK